MHFYLVSSKNEMAYNSYTIHNISNKINTALYRIKVNYSRNLTEIKSFPERYP